MIFTAAEWRVFLDLDRIPIQAGVRPDRLAALALKELVDNALDAGVTVRWDWLIEPGSGLEDRPAGFYVEDDGPGIPGEGPAEIAALFSISRPFMSSKAIRLPTRGALGNGLRVVSAIAFASGGGLAVETKGHRITIGLDELDGTARPATVEALETIGTRIEVRIGPALNLYDLAEAGRWADQALFLAGKGKPYKGKTSPWWYPEKAFLELCRSAPAGLTVRQLVERFDGCTGRKAGDIAGPFKGIEARALGEDQAREVLRRMREASAPVTPDRLGSLGSDAYNGHGGREAFTYAKAAGTRSDGIPYVVEVWAAPADDRTRIEVTVNGTPITGDVSAEHSAKEKALWVRGCGISQDGYHQRIEKVRGPVCVFVNVIAPHMPITSAGKAPDFSGMRRDIIETIGKAARRAARSVPAVVEERPDKAPSARAVIFYAIPDAARKAGGGLGFSLRQVYYVIRPIVREVTGRDLDYGYFSGVVSDYENEHGDIPGMYRDDRGILYHPHEHRDIPLGTKAAAGYFRPVWTFNKCLFIEKEGFCQTLKELRWPEKNDCALITSKGHATRALKDVVDRLAESNEPITVFCVHDADAAGTMIYQSLQEATRARGRRKVEIVNLGLEPWEALDMDLEIEAIPGKPARRPVADYVTAYVEEHNTRDYDAWLQTHRIELNAMSSREFVAWLDEKIAAYPGKLIPPVEVLAARLRAETEEAIARTVREQIERETAERFNRETAEALTAAGPALEKVIKTLPLWVPMYLEKWPEKSWRNAIGTAAEAVIEMVTGPGDDQDPGGPNGKFTEPGRPGGQDEPRSRPAEFSTAGGSA